MASFNTFCDPVVGQTLRSDFASGFDTGVIFGNAAILGGIPSAAPTNVNCGDLSVILMGDTNTINTFSGVNSKYSVIGNGTNNNAAGNYANIFNGDSHNLCGQYSTM